MTKMKLDEAIKHAEEIANEKERIGAMGRGNPDKYAPSPEQCFKCAEEHRQLAEWLKELQEFKKREEPRRPIRTYVLVEGQEGARIDVWACPKCASVIETERDGERKLGTFLRERCRWCGQIIDWRNATANE